MASTPSPGCAVSIRGLSHRFGRRRVLDGVDLDIPTGVIQGLVGLNGSGKTTTLDCVLGLLRPTAGRIETLGAPPERLHRLGGRVAGVFDAPCLHPRLTARQELEVARLTCRERARPIDEIEALLGLGPYRDVRTGRLSLGNRRRLSIARALLSRPELVILDEPFSGLDAGGVDAVLELFRRTHAQDGTTLLLASHQLPYMETACQRIAILHEGRIALEGATEDLLRRRGARLALRAGAPERALDVLRRLDGVREPALALDGRIEIALEGATPAAVNRALVLAGLDVSEIVESRATLEAVFRQATEAAA